MTSREAEAWLLRNSDPKQPLKIEKLSQQPTPSTLAVLLAYAVHGMPEQGHGQLLSSSLL